MLQNIIATIALDSGTHIQKKVFHIFPFYTQRRVDIVIIRDSFQNLANVVIVDLTHPDLVQCVLTTTAHATIVATQHKA